MKVTSNDLLAILRKFNIADDSNVPRQIERIKISHPSAINTAARFLFNKTVYFALFDETAQDSESYIVEQIKKIYSDTNAGRVLENPTSHITTYGLPFHGKDCYLYKITNDKKRLDVVLAERYPDISRSTWQKYIRNSNISVNGEIKTIPKTEITPLDTIEVKFPEATDYTDSSFPIVFLDEDVIVINKPIGVLTHSKGSLNDEFTVADFFARYTSVGLHTNRPGIVHRLDRDTSGVMIGALKPDSFELLKKQFSNRKVKKTYLAIVDGTPKQPTAIIDLPIGRNPNAPSTFRVDAKGKAAITKYTVIAQANGKSLVMLNPETGRTHQLRVHMAHIGTPITGDRIYGKAGERLYLHAKQLELTLPGGKREIFQTKTPNEFTNQFPEAKIDD